MAEQRITGPDWANPPPPPPRPGWCGWFRILRRGMPVIAVLASGVPILILLRVAERLFTGHRRPVTGPFVQAICRIVLWLLGLGWKRIGIPVRGPGAVVANHSSWLDIFTLNAAMPVFFVSKSEVSGWPGINILTYVTNTHFVTRDPRLASEQATELAARAQAGHRLLLFPEGTSSDGQRVLPFKPTLFQGFLSPDLPENFVIQPVTAIYHAPAGADPRFYGWWGNMNLGPHILAVLATPLQGQVEIILHDPVPIAGQNRKSLSYITEAKIRSVFPQNRA